MGKVNIHQITAHINNYLSINLDSLITEPCQIFLLDVNKEIVFNCKSSLLQHDFPQINHLQKHFNTKRTYFEIQDYCVNIAYIELLPNHKFYLCLVIKQNTEQARSLLNLIVALLQESIQKIIQQNIIDKNEQFTFAIMNAVNFAVLSTNLNGDILYANNQACRQLNIRRRDLITKKISELIPNWQRITQTLSEGNEIQNEETTIDNGNETLNFNLNCSAITDIDTTKIGYVVTFRSIEKVYQLVNKYTGMQARYYFNDIIGKSKLIRQAIQYAQTISNSPSTILIEGESGTGKEVFAQSIHNASNRKHNSFVAINCAAISENLIESELFGYDDGAFTGAKKGGHPGKFELANNGTLFLDEIGDMKPNMQVKLLRAIQESSITRVGGNKVIPVDVRIIAATNKNLQEEVEKGNFRMDLFYRISVIPLHIPSLRERKGDLPALIRFFLNQKSLKLQKDIPHIGYSVLQQLLDYDWPGNVRELENYTEQLVIFNGKISLDGFHQLKNQGTNPMKDSSLLQATESTSDLTLQENEKRHITLTLKKHMGNITQVAKSLGIGRNTLYQKIKKYNISTNKE